MYARSTTFHGRPGNLDAGIAFTNLRRPLSPEELAQIEREPAQRH